jgi:hypothetical protein
LKRGEVYRRAMDDEYKGYKLQMMNTKDTKDTKFE